MAPVKTFRGLSHLTSLAQFEAVLCLIQYERLISISDSVSMSCGQKGDCGTAEVRLNAGTSHFLSNGLLIEHESLSRGL